MWADAWLVAAKDLRLELRSRVGLYQIVPFALMVLFLFAFAIDPDRDLLAELTAGLYWVAVLFSSILAVQRSFSLENSDGNRDGLRMAGLDPAGIFVGKALAIAAQLLVLEAVLLAGVALFYETPIRGFGLLIATAVAATTGIVAPGTIYGALSAGVRVRDTIFPLLLLPVLAPVMIGATQAFEAALSGRSADGWPWAGLVAVFGAVYIGFGIAVSESLLEET